MIHREEISTSAQRTIVTAMVTSTPFLQKVSTIYQPEFLDGPLRTIAGWTLDYLGKYRTCPGKSIETIYAKALNSGEISPAEGEAIALTLDWMSTEWENGDHVNVDFLLDTAVRFFEGENLGLTADSVKHYLDKGDVEGASEILADHRPVRMVSGSTIRVLTDLEAVDRTFSAAPEPLFRLQGALGELLNDSLVRDFLLGIQAPEKRGKTFFLIELLFRACMARCNVAYFSVGDLSESQLLNRLYMRMTRLSPKSSTVRVNYVDCLKNQKDTCDSNERPATSGPIRDDSGVLLPRASWGKYSPCSYCAKHGIDFPGVIYSTEEDFGRVLGPSEAKRALRSLQRRMGKKELRVHVTPTFTTSIIDIDHELTRWFEEDGFVPDVIFIDYADILAPIDSRKEERGQINDTWGYARKLSQEKHALVILPTQADAASYEQENVTLRNFSNDKRKYAHVNGMLGLHMTEEEKELGLLRTSWILLREGEWTINQQVCCARSLSQGISYVGGWWRKDPEPVEEEAEDDWEE